MRAIAGTSPSFCIESHLYHERSAPTTHQDTLDGVAFVRASKQHVVAAVPLVLEYPHPSLRIVGQLHRLVEAVLPVQLVAAGDDERILVLKQRAGGEVEQVRAPPVVIHAAVSGGVVVEAGCDDDMSYWSGTALCTSHDPSACAEPSSTTRDPGGGAQCSSNRMVTLRGASSRVHVAACSCTRSRTVHILLVGCNDGSHTAAGDASSPTLCLANTCG